MSTSWRVPTPDIQRVLEGRGFDVVLRSWTADTLVSDIQADRELGPVHIQLVIDGSGRIRCTTTRVADEETLLPMEVGDVHLTRVRVVEEITTATGRINSLADLGAILSALGFDANGH